MRVEGGGRGNAGRWRPPQAMGSPARGQARGCNGSRLGCVVLDVGHDASVRTCYDASATASGWPGAGKKVIEGVAGPGAEQIEDPPAHRGGFGADHPPGQGGDRGDAAHDRIDALVAAAGHG